MELQYVHLYYFVGLDLQPEIQTLKVCTLIYDICVWHTLVKNKQMMYVIYDIGCQSLHGCEWRCRCFLSLFRQLCKCSFFVLCYMWPDTPLGLFSAPALKVTFFSQEIIVTNIYVFRGSSQVSLMTWICLHFCFQLECY